MTDSATGVDARNALLDIAQKWALLHAPIAGRGGRALTGMPTGRTADAIPIDTHIVYLMTEIDWKVAQHYCHGLVDETDDVAAAPTTPEARVRLVAERYGH